MRWDKAHLGDWLLQLRTAAGMSQERLGERVKRSRQQISEYEKGERDPAGTVLLNLLDELGVQLVPGPATQGRDELLAQLAEGQERLADQMDELGRLVAQRSTPRRVQRQGQ